MRSWSWALKSQELQWLNLTSEGHKGITSSSDRDMELCAVVVYRSLCDKYEFKCQFTIEKNMEHERWRLIWVMSGKEVEGTHNICFACFPNSWVLCSRWMVYTWEGFWFLNLTLDIQDLININFHWTTSVMLVFITCHFSLFSGSWEHPNVWTRPGVSSHGGSHSVIHWRGSGAPGGKQTT